MASRFDTTFRNPFAQQGVMGASTGTTSFKWGIVPQMDLSGAQSGPALTRTAANRSALVRSDAG